MAVLKGLIRKSNGKTKVSSQTLIDHNTILANYTSEGAYQTAVNSYGGERKVFLTPAAMDGNDSNGNDSGSGAGNPAMKTLTLTVSPSGAGTVTVQVSTHRALMPQSRRQLQTAMCSANGATTTPTQPAM